MSNPVTYRNNRAAAMEAPPECTRPESGRLFAAYLAGCSIGEDDAVAALHHQVTCPACQRLLEKAGPSSHAV
ncbi:MAG TPA: hypothetical protein VHR66_10835 [Gemmataceae bacterium]|nr:hypothetical protein [Gemmataceae bacterium]